MSNLSWLSRLVSENEGSVKLLNGTNLAFSGTEIVVSDGPSLNILHEFDVGTYGSGHYVIHAECGTDQRETLNASVVAKYDSASITVYGRINTGVNLINVQADITDGVLKLYATSAVQGLQKIRVTAFATLAASIVDVESKATVYYFSSVNATPKYTLNLGLYSVDETAPSLTFYKGLTYRIDQSDPSNSQDPILIGETADAVNNTYVLGVSYYLDNKKVIRQTYTDLARYQTASSRYIEVSVSENYPNTLHYFSATRPQLGNNILVTSIVDVGSAGSGSSGTGGGGSTPTTGANQELSNLGVTAINSSLIPAVDSSIDLGSAFNKWKDLYLSGNTLFLGNASITATGNAINLPAGSTVGGQAIGSGGANSAFSIVSVAGQSDILSSSIGSAINFAAGSNIFLTTDPLTGTITISSAGGGGGGASGNAFTTIAVSGQSPVIADSVSDTLTLIAGPNITLTTNPAGDAITISSSASGGGGSGGVSTGQANRLAYYASTGAVVQDSGPNLEWNGTFLQVVGTVYVTGQKSYVRQYWDSLSDLNIEAPPNVWRGMVAYSGDTGRVYYAHNSSWNRLARFDEIPATPTSFGRIQAGGQTISSTAPNDILSVVGGVGIQITSDPTTKTLLITNTGGGTGGETGFSAEDAQDSAASLFLTGQHTGITFTYDDFNNRINAAVTAIAGIYTDEQAQDAAGLALTSGVHNGITFTYDDANNRIDASIFNDSAREYIQDQSAALFTSGVHSNISFTYDDASNRINASVPVQNTFSTIAVSGQTNVVADSSTDTLTLVAGAGIAITTNSESDAITITSVPIASGTQANSFKNLIINGDMMIDQRSNRELIDGAQGTEKTVIVNKIYTLDRWAAHGVPSAGVFTVQGSSSGATMIGEGFTRALRISTPGPDPVTTTGRIYRISQTVEGYLIRRTGWGWSSTNSLTLSFWVRSRFTGLHGGSVTNGTATRSYVFGFNINSAFVWERKTITIPAPPIEAGEWNPLNNGAGLVLSFTIAASSSALNVPGSWLPGAFYGPVGLVNGMATSFTASYEITGVQLEVGTSSTPFEFLPVSVQFGLCKRYYHRISLAVGQTLPYSTGIIRTATSARGAVEFPVPMRTRPLPPLETTEIASQYAVEHGLTFTTLSTVPQWAGSSEYVAYINFIVSGGLTPGQACTLTRGGNDSMSFIAFDVEL